MIVPRGLDDFDLDVGVHLGELGCPSVYIVLIGGGHGRDHNGNGVFCRCGILSRGGVPGCSGLIGSGCGRLTAGAESKYHAESEEHCDDLFH